MSALKFLNMILVAILIILAAIVIVNFLYELYVKIMVKRSATVLSEDEFRKNMRKAQVIDVREKSMFDAGHILGARNIPYTVLKDNLASIRRDQPVYLYEQSKALSARAANVLRKNGYQDIYILKGGYEEWTGKIKKKQA